MSGPVGRRGEFPAGTQVPGYRTVSGPVELVGGLLVLPTAAGAGLMEEEDQGAVAGGAKYASPRIVRPSAVRVVLLA